MSHTNTPIKTTSLIAICSLLAFMLLPLLAEAAVGKVEYTTGLVNIVSSSGQSREVSKGADIEQGDTLKTLDGRAQLRFNDGGFISLQPYTDFQVEEYEFKGKGDTSAKSFFKLFKGGLRAITGSIGQLQKESYKVTTPTATIGIRGTEFLARQDGDRLLVRVGRGAVFLQNGAGNLVIYRGQSGVVGSPTQAPKQSTESPSVTAASPTGSVGEEVTQNSNTQSVYVDGNVRFASDSLCQTGSGDCSAIVSSSGADFDALLAGGLANIPRLNALAATAAYFGQNTLSLGGGSATVFEGLGIDFSSYQVYFQIDGDFASGSYSGANIYAEALGSLNSSTGGFTFADTGNGEIYDFVNFVTLANVTLNGSGQLNASNLSQANLTYQVFDGSQTATLSSVLNGFAASLNVGLEGIGRLNALGSTADYFGSSSFTLQGSTASVSDNMNIDFLDYSVLYSGTGSFNAAGLYANHTYTAFLVGSLNSGNGAVSLSQSFTQITDGMGSITPTVTASGQLNPANLSQATINYSVSDGSATGTGTSNLTGSLFSSTFFD